MHGMTSGVYAYEEPIKRVVSKKCPIWSAEMYPDNSKVLVMGPAMCKTCEEISGKLQPRCDVDDDDKSAMKMEIDSQSSTVIKAEREENATDHESSAIDNNDYERSSESEGMVDRELRDDDNVVEEVFEDQTQLLSTQEQNRDYEVKFGMKSNVGEANNELFPHEDIVGPNCPICQSQFRQTCVLRAHLRDPPCTTSA